MFDNPLTLVNVNRLSKFFSPVDSQENSLCIYHKDFHPTWNMLLHYLVKAENPKTLLILTASSTNCWHVPEDTLRTSVNIQTVSRLLTLTDWHILKFVRQRLEATVERCSVECCCIIVIFFTMIIFASSLFSVCYTLYVLHIFQNKKLSCRRETERRFVSLNILLSHAQVHSRSFEMTLLSRACVSRY